MKKLEWFLLICIVVVIPTILLTQHLSFISWAGNKGIFDFLSLLLTIAGLYLAWRTLIQPLLREREDKKNTQKLLEQTLLKEFWYNMGLVDRIKNSYENNLKEENVHVPHYRPRKASLERITDYKFLSVWEDYPKDQQTLLEVLEQTEMFIEQYEDWKEKVILNPNFTQNKELYKEYSKSMLNIADALMKNMLELWKYLILKEDLIRDIKNDDIRRVGQKLNEVSKEVNYIAVAQYSLYFKKEENRPQEPPYIIMCWYHNWDNPPEDVKDVIELRSYIS